MSEHWDLTDAKSTESPETTSTDPAGAPEDGAGNDAAAAADAAPASEPEPLDPSLVALAAAEEAVAAAFQSIIELQQRLAAQETATADIAAMAQADAAAAAAATADALQAADAAVTAAQAETAAALRSLSRLQTQFGTLQNQYDGLYVDMSEPTLWQIDVEPPTGTRVRLLVMAGTLERAVIKARGHTLGKVVGVNGNLGVIFVA
jgi:flagellin-like hook-associated protein FlgL